MLSSHNGREYGLTRLVEGIATIVLLAASLEAGTARESLQLDGLCHQFGDTTGNPATRTSPPPFFVRISQPYIARQKCTPGSFEIPIHRRRGDLGESQCGRHSQIPPSTMFDTAGSKRKQQILKLSAKIGAFLSHQAK